MHGADCPRVASVGVTHLLPTQPPPTDTYTLSLHDALPISGMVYAKVAYPPTREAGKHTAVDDSAAKKVKGYVATVVTPGLVAVVATTYENAVKARDALRITWDQGPNANVSSESIFAAFAKKAAEDTSALAWLEQGDVKAAMAQAPKRHEATFTTDYVAHMQMEPMNCVVRFADGAYDIHP